MVFSNLVFLFVFLPILLLVYFIAPMKLRNYVLLIASLLFYAWGEPKYVFLMLLSIAINYVFGLIIDKYAGNKKAQKTALVIAILANVGILGFYKYANFLVESINSIVGTSFTIEPVALPIGISFFTFQAISYVVDIYRKEANVQKNFFDLSLYISLFPQLVAGPIVKYTTVANEIKNRVVTSNLFVSGLQRFILGLSKKVLIANPLGSVADGVFAMSPDAMTTSTAWIGIIAYSLQIYFDFSGYSDMAIGLGRMFGFKFLENFNYPYVAKSATEFWRRWHISLGSWFREYIYIPLGGNRVVRWKFYRNILIVWALTGIWHGASWVFMLWGLYFGVILLIEKSFLLKLLEKLWTPLQHLYLILIVIISWVFFRAESLDYATSMFGTMFGLNGTGLIDGYAITLINDNGLIFLVAIILSIPVYAFVSKKLEPLTQSASNIWISVPLSTLQVIMYMILFMLVVISLVNSTYNPFIYFRF